MVKVRQISMTTTSKLKRPPRTATKPEPLYIWLPIALLAKGDFIVTNQQEVCVQGIIRQDDEWHVSFTNPATRHKEVEFYRSHHYLYTKATSEVKARLASKQDETKGGRP